MHIITHADIRLTVTSQLHKSCCLSVSFNPFRKLTTPAVVSTSVPIQAIIKQEPECIDFLGEESRNRIPTTGPMNPITDGALFIDQGQVESVRNQTWWLRRPNVSPSPRVRMEKWRQKSADNRFFSDHTLMQRGIQSNCSTGIRLHRKYPLDDTWIRERQSVTPQIWSTDCVRLLPVFMPAR